MGSRVKSVAVSIRTVADFQAAARCDGDGYASTDGDYINDCGTVQNIECYGEEPCPECGDGCVFGADFPNGATDGVCLNCGAELIWDNDDGAWVVECLPDFAALRAWVNSDALPPADSDGDVVQAHNGLRFCRCDDGGIWLEGVATDGRPVTLAEAKALIMR